MSDFVGWWQTQGALGHGVAIVAAIVLYIFSCGCAYGYFLNRFPNASKYHAGEWGGNDCNGDHTCPDCQVAAGFAAVVWPIFGVVRFAIFGVVIPVLKAGSKIVQSGVHLTSAK